MSDNYVVDKGCVPCIYVGTLSLTWVGRYLTETLMDPIEVKEFFSPGVQLLHSGLGLIRRTLEISSSF